MQGLTAYERVFGTLRKDVHNNVSYKFGFYMLETFETGYKLHLADAELQNKFGDSGR